MPQARRSNTSHPPLFKTHTFVIDWFSGEHRDDLDAAIDFRLASAVVRLSDKGRCPRAKEPCFLVHHRSYKRKTGYKDRLRSNEVHFNTTFNNALINISVCKQSNKTKRPNIYLTLRRILLQICTKELFSAIFTMKEFI